VCENEDVTEFWNQGYTKRHVRANRTNNIFKHKKERKCIVVDVAVLSERNVMQKEEEKNLNARVYVEQEMN
jgi:hypothetical protein